VHAHLGLNFSEHHENDLIRKIGYAAQEFGYSNSTEFVEWLLTNSLSEQQTGILASFLTIGETYFLREKKSFDFLEQIYLPGLINKRNGADKRLRVWCAGCATGEEAYSIAIVLLQSIPDIQLWDISILATDINSVFLEKAKKGIYSKWSFRNNSEKSISKYFTKVEPNEFHVLPEIKKMVTFAPLNLAADCYPSPTTNTSTIDIIFCRNVFIYFSEEGTRAVTNRFYQSLVKGGILVVSPVEMSGMISPEFNKINFSGFTIYQKGSHKAEETQSDFKGFHSLPVVPPVPWPVVKNDPLVYADDLSGLDRLKKLLPEKKFAEPLLPAEQDYDKALALYSRGSFEETETLLDRLIKREHSNGKPAMFLLAKTKANLSKLKEAEELCERAMQIDKLDPGLYYLMATIMQEQGNDEKAIQLLNRAIYLDRDFVLAFFLLGSLSMKSGNHETGKKSFRNAITSLSRLHPDDALPESDGITVGRFREILNSLTC